MNGEQFRLLQNTEIQLKYRVIILIVKREITMRRTAAEIKKSTEEWLDERWMIANMNDARPQDVSYYNGTLKAVEFLGYDWQRDEDGKHTLYKR